MTDEVIEPVHRQGHDIVTGVGEQAVQLSPQHAVERQVAEIVASPHVAVEAGLCHAEQFGDAPHGQRLGPLTVEDLDGRVGERRAGEHAPAHLVPGSASQ